MSRWARRVDDEETPNRVSLIVFGRVGILPGPLANGSRSFFRGTNDDGSAGLMGVKKTGKGRRKIGRKKRKMRSKIRHRK
jgi:hypothetical protein